MLFYACLRVTWSQLRIANLHRDVEHVPWQQFARSVGEVLCLAPLPLPCLCLGVRNGHDLARMPSLGPRPRLLHRLQTRTLIPRTLILLPYVVWRPFWDVFSIVSMRWRKGDVGYSLGRSIGLGLSLAFPRFPSFCLFLCSSKRSRRLFTREMFKPSVQVS